MKIAHLITSFAGAAALLATNITHSANFHEASTHLDLDGSLVGFIDFEGDGQAIGTSLNTIYQDILANTPEMMPIPMDFNQLFTNLGFGSVRSFAMSSKEIEPDLHRNRSVLLLNDEMTGLFSMYGQALQPFRAAELAPADATGAMTMTVEFTPIRDTVISILQQSMGDMGVAMAQQQLATPVPGTDITADEVIEALSGNWDGFWHQAYKEAFQQDIKFWVRIEGAGSLLPRVMPLLKDMPVVIDETDAATVIDLSPMLGEDSPIDIFIKVPEGSSDLIIYSNKNWTPSSAGPRLSEDPKFTALAKRLPKEGLAYTYSVGADMSPLWALLEAEPEAAKYQVAIQAAMELLISDYLAPTVSVTTLKDNAMITEQYAGYSTKQVIMVLPAAIGGGIGAAMAIPAFQKVRTTSQEKAVTNNLRQIASAADQYFLEEGVTEVSIDKLIGTYIYSLTPVAGESYENMTITADMTEISVVLGDGRVISVDF
jgi:type IV pilus assembly protein PilA